MDLLQKFTRKNASLVRLFAVFVAVFLLMLCLVPNPSKFLAFANLQSMMFQIPELGIFTVAVTFAMFLGGIDLSVVSIGNLSGILSTTLVVYLTGRGVAGGAAVAAGVALALVVGTACGLLNGLIVHRLGIPAMLATLATMQIFQGLGVILTNGSAVTGLPKAYGAIGAATLGGVPVSMLLFVGIIVLTSILMSRRRTGMEIYLQGTNQKAAEFSGIRTGRVVMKTFLISGLLASVAGIIISSRVMSAKADYGSSYILQCLLVAILGGISPFGGFGAIAGILLSVMTLQILGSGFNMMRFSSYQTLFVWGLLLILVMVANHLAENSRLLRKLRARLRPAQKESKSHQ